MSVVKKIQSFTRNGNKAAYKKIKSGPNAVARKQNRTGKAMALRQLRRSGKWSQLKKEGRAFS
jgi:hypothetical protein